MLGGGVPPVLYIYQEIKLIKFNCQAICFQQMLPSSHYTSSRGFFYFLFFKILKEVTVWRFYSPKKKKAKLVEFTLKIIFFPTIQVIITLLYKTLGVGNKLINYLMIFFGPNRLGPK